tara:strand:+ start:378 stop:1109 length:732 start_codon:yes stop_codon:yes gene_type:complete
MIVLIYTLCILYILAFFIHKALKIWLSTAIELNKRIRKRIVLWTVLKILDIILQNIYILIGAVIIVIGISCFLVFIYIYYRFLLIPISKLWPIGCALYKAFSFFPITELKKIGIFDFLDKILFKNKYESGIVTNIILDATIKNSVSKEMYQQIKDSIIKDSSFSIESICGDTKKLLEQNDQFISQTQKGLSHADMIDLKREALIKQCTNSKMQNYVSNEDSNFTKGIQNKLFKNVCTATYSSL